MKSQKSTGPLRKGSSQAAPAVWHSRAARCLKLLPWCRVARAMVVPPPLSALTVARAGETTPLKWLRFQKLRMSADPHARLCVSQRPMRSYRLPDVAIRCLAAGPQSVMFLKRARLVGAGSPSAVCLFKDLVLRSGLVPPSP